MKSVGDYFCQGTGAAIAVTIHGLPVASDILPVCAGCLVRFERLNNRIEIQRRTALAGQIAEKSGLMTVETLKNLHEYVPGIRIRRMETKKVQTPQLDHLSWQSDDTPNLSTTPSRLNAIRQIAFHTVQFSSDFPVKF